MDLLAAPVVGPVARALGRDLWGSVADRATDLGLDVLPPAGPPVTDDDLAPLPDPARRYLHAVGVVGRPRDRSFRARLVGRFRRSPSDAWMACDAWQYDGAHPIARIFHMRLDLLRVVPMVGADTYVGGHGRMVGKLLGLVTVADGSGREFDIGELTTWLNDALLLAPSMLLDERVTWTAVDADRFGIALTDAGHTVRAEVVVGPDDLVRDFTTTDRWCDLPEGLAQVPWSTPVEEWTESAGRLLPTRARAVWALPDGPFTYVDGAFAPGSVAHDVVPRRR